MNLEYRTLKFTFIFGKYIIYLIFKRNVTILFIHVFSDN